MSFNALHLERLVVGKLCLNKMDVGTSREQLHGFLLGCGLVPNQSHDNILLIKGELSCKFELLEGGCCERLPVARSRVGAVCSHLHQRLDWHL